jgi:hypothetical protein
MLERNSFVSFIFFSVFFIVQIFFTSTRNDERIAQEVGESTWFSLRHSTSSFAFDIFVFSGQGQRVKLKSFTSHVERRGRGQPPTLFQSSIPLLLAPPSAESGGKGRIKGKKEEEKLERELDVDFSAPSFSSRMKERNGKMERRKEEGERREAMLVVADDVASATLARPVALLSFATSARLRRRFLLYVLFSCGVAAAVPPPALLSDADRRTEERNRL